MSYDRKTDSKAKPPVAVWLGERRYEVLAFNPRRQEVVLRTEFNFRLAAPLRDLRLSPPAK